MLKNKIFRIILTVILTIATLTSAGMAVHAYSSEDFLATKLYIFGCSSLRNDINDDGTTNVLDVLELKHDLIKDTITMQGR
jgi:hypothetical protein